MRALLRRFFYRYNDEVTSGRAGDNMRSGEMPFLPAVRLLSQFSFRVINVDGNFGMLDLCSHPKPIFVSFEQLLPHCFLLAGAEIAAPIVFPHLKSFLYVRFRRLESEGLRVINRGDASRSKQ